MVKGEAYFWGLWGVAYLVNGGCSDDGFEYFRNWLVLQDRDVFEAAVRHPDSLADVVDPDEEDYECECRPAWDAWFEKTGTVSEQEGYNVLLVALKKRHLKRIKERIMGRRWDFDDDNQVRRRLTRLAALYLDRDGDGTGDEDN